MAYVVAATLRAKPGQERTVEEAIRAVTPLSRAEPGCVFYQAQRSLDDPTHFFVYEQYVDLAGFEAHQATPHFEQYVRGQIAPNLASRERAVFETLD